MNDFCITYYLHEVVSYIIRSALLVLIDQSSVKCHTTFVLSVEGGMS